MIKKKKERKKEKKVKQTKNDKYWRSLRVFLITTEIKINLLLKTQNFTDDKVL